MRNLVGYRRISDIEQSSSSIDGYAPWSFQPADRSRLKSRPAQFLLESAMPEGIRLRIACFPGHFWI
jgi:hypothetical protein